MSRYLDGIMGLVVGDALGVPAEFMPRGALRKNPITGMFEGGAHEQPAGTWSDDSSMALATLDSLRNGYDPKDIMDRFVRWLNDAEYTARGETFDVGNTCCWAIKIYERGFDIKACGQTDERANGNGSLMRIMPICLYAYEKQRTDGIPDNDALAMVNEVSSLTHAHPRSLMACGIYYYIVKAILDETGSISDRLQHGITQAFVFYEKQPGYNAEIIKYDRIRDIEAFVSLPEDDIRSSGYVIDTLEAALWCLLTTENYAHCTLRAVNLGDDTDTVAAVAGGLAGLYYGYDDIPEEWLEVIARREWIEQMIKGDIDGRE